jgi:CubicO group peptidase (beta-lactamase class C family)
MVTKLRTFIPLFLVLVITSCAQGETVTDTAIPKAEKSTDTEPEVDYWSTNSWRESTPDEQGMDEVLLQKMLEEIDEQGLEIDSLLVVRNGYIITEKYYSPYEQDTQHGVYSVTKSIISALIGIAIQEGFIDSVNDPVLNYFPERNIDNYDALKRSITIEHLLTMSAGLKWDWDEMISTPDYVQYVLDQPMYSEPGAEFFYSSGNAHVLSAIIQETSGLNANNFAQKYLFDYLGIDDLSWKKDLSGISKGGWGMKMKPRDMAKFGYLYLNQGKWDGQQIIPAEWIEASTKSYHQVPEPLEPWDLYMGYFWWLHEDGIYAAHGMKGQFIYVIPEFDLVVVITSHLPDSRFAQPQLLIRGYIIPAVQ